MRYLEQAAEDVRRLYYHICAEKAIVEANYDAFREALVNLDVAFFPKTATQGLPFAATTTSHPDKSIDNLSYDELIKSRKAPEGEHKNYLNIRKKMGVKGTTLGTLDIARKELFGNTLELSNEDKEIERRLLEIYDTVKATKLAV